MRTRLAGLVATIAIASCAVPAFAGSTPKDKAQAKQLVSEAHAAQKQKRYADAEAALRKADELDPNPQTKLDLGKVLAVDGKLVEASKVLHAVADDPKPVSKRSADAAKKELASVEPRIAWLQLTVSGAPEGKASATVDGQSIDMTGEAPIDPGEHVLRAEADGYDRVEKKVTLTDGDHAKIEVRLTRSASDATPVADKKPEEGSSGSKGSVVPALIAFGIGAVGIGVGTVFGVMAFDEKSKADDLKLQYERTGSKQARADFDSALSTSKANGTVSTVAFIAGGVGVTAGVVLLIVRPGGSSSAPPKSDETSLRVEPWVGAGRAGLAGVF